MKTNLSKNLKFLRSKSGKNQTEIGLQLGKAHTSIGNWEKGISEPSLEEISELARIFEISPSDLIYSDLENGKKNPDQQANQDLKTKNKKEKVLPGVDNDISKLIDSNFLLSKSTHDLSKHIIFLSGLINSNGSVKNVSASSPNQADFLELLAMVHSKEIKFQSKTEALSVMSKMLSDIQKGEPITYNYSE